MRPAAALSLTACESMGVCVGSAALSAGAGSTYQPKPAPLGEIVIDSPAD